MINKLIDVEEVRENADLKETTLEYMKKYGWQNVRGYAWSQWNMKNPPKELGIIQREVLMNADYLIYILKLENNKWYIGKTTNLRKELKLHRKGLKIPWTTTNKVLRVEKLIENGDYKEIILNYIKKCGEQNVRAQEFESERKMEEERQNLAFTYETKDRTLLELNTEDLKPRVEVLKDNYRFKGLFALGRYYPADRYPSLHNQDYFTNKILELKKDNHQVASEITSIFLHFIKNFEKLQVILNQINYIVMMPTTRAINHLKQWGESLINKLHKQDITDLVYIIDERKHYFDTYKFKSPWDRKSTVNGAFKLKASKKEKIKLKGKACLILDDVCTTGTQINELTNTLVAEGAKEVYGLVIAKTKSVV